jgi:hypothetical protein
VVAALLGIAVAEVVSGGTNVGRSVEARAQVPLEYEVEAGHTSAVVTSTALGMRAAPTRVR